MSTAEGVKVLVTGGAGHVGTHAALELLETGHEPVLLDNLSNSSAEAVTVLAALAGHPVPFVEGDVRDRDCLDRVFGKGQFDAVVHLAALKAVGDSVANPLRYYDTNLGGTVRVLEAMDRHGVR